MEAGTTLDPEPRAELQSPGPGRGLQLDHHLSLTWEACEQLLQLAEHARRQRGRVEAQVQRTGLDRPTRSRLRRVANLIGRRRESLDRRRAARSRTGDDAGLVAILVIDPSSHHND